jgi:antitoxin VapB
MALSIKDKETDRLAREVSRLTGESLTEAIKASLKERLRRLDTKRKSAGLAAELDRIALEIAALPVLDDRSPDEILGYDENGLPT